MGTSLRYIPTSYGIIFRLDGPNGRTELGLSRQEVAETVTNMCKAAGLPEPWKKG